MILGGRGRVARRCSTFLQNEQPAENTIRRRCGIAKQFFRAAQRRGLIDSNPFAELKAAVQANASRFYFITREEAQRVLESCPDGQWRLLLERLMVNSVQWAMRDSNETPQRTIL